MVITVFNRSFKAAFMITSVIAACSLLPACTQNQPEAMTNNETETSNSASPTNSALPNSSAANNSESKLNSVAATASSTYVSAEPLSGRRIKVSVTAKDKTLYIRNCNGAIAPSLINAQTKDPVWGGVSDACLSADIVIPKGETLTFVTHINDDNLPLDQSYKAVIGALSYDSFEEASKSDKAAELDISQQTSNEFNLLP